MIDLELLNKKLNESDVILVGIGTELQDTNVEFYTNLYSYMKEKNYFIVSLCTDDIIYKSEFAEEKIVTPCGGHRKLQCEKNCNNKIYDYNNIIGKHEMVCPDCGEKLVFNEIHEENYCEEGYLNQWNVYTKWLQNTINRKLTILELGVAMEFPSVIRWPFEKVAFYNQKSFFFRINSKYPQLPEGVGERGFQEKEKPQIFFMK